MAEIYLAGGCFWGLEKYLESISGVTFTEVGYANGRTSDPTYEEVCNNNTGHAETVHVIYDESVLSLQFLLELYYDVIDPIAVNRQGNDRGTQYRTGIYYTDTDDLSVINDSIAKLQTRFNKPIAIEIKPLENFTVAEDYHQKYLDRNPNGYCHINKNKFLKAENAIIDPSEYTKINKNELQNKISETQFNVTQNNHTEPQFKNEYWNSFKSGIYVDITTGEPLFSSSDKFESGCGWPSFAKPIDPNVIKEKTDLKYGMQRTEVRSRVGDSHLGHVFEDGPEESGGLRYCINSASLRFIPKVDMEKEGYGYLLKYIK